MSTDFLFQQMQCYIGIQLGAAALRSIDANRVGGRILLWGGPVGDSWDSVWSEEVIWLQGLSGLCISQYRNHCTLQWTRNLSLLSMWLSLLLPT